MPTRLDNSSLSAWLEAVSVYLPISDEVTRHYNSVLWLTLTYCLHNRQTLKWKIIILDWNSFIDIPFEILSFQYFFVLKTSLKTVEPQLQQ